MKIKMKKQKKEMMINYDSRAPEHTKKWTERVVQRTAADGTLR